MFIEMKNPRLIAQTRIGYDAQCSSGGAYSDWDIWVVLRVNKKHKFSSRYGPETQRYKDGTTADYWGEISGTVNRGSSKISGRARFKAVYYDNAATVTDSCDSGPLRWTAKQ